MTRKHLKRFGQMTHAASTGIAVKVGLFLLLILTFIPTIANGQPASPISLQTSEAR